MATSVETQDGQVSRLSVWRRTTLAVLGVGALLGASACSTGGGASIGLTAPGGSGSGTPAAVTVGPMFTSEVFHDPVTGESLPYNLHLPADYDPARAYPMVLYLADAGATGSAVTTPLADVGARVWAADAEQALRPSIVVVPEYPGPVIDDTGSATDDYLEMTTRLVTSLEISHAVDQGRVYGTGEGMGATAVAHLAAEHPGLFAGVLLVGGRPDLADPVGLADSTLVSVVAADDRAAVAAQSALEDLLAKRHVTCATATWQTAWSSARLSASATSVLAQGDRATLVRLEGGGAVNAYRIPRLREWLLRQSAT